MHFNGAVETYNQFVRGDALIGIMPDPAGQEQKMYDGFWAAAGANPEAFRDLGDAHHARVKTQGAFEGVDPEAANDHPFSERVLAIELPDEALQAAARCYAEGAIAGDRSCVLRFARIARYADPAGQELATELFAALKDLSPAEIYQFALVHHWRGQVERAAELHHQAAELGDLDAQFELYIYYAQGVGVAQDAAQSDAWLNRAAAGGHPRAVFNLGANAARAGDFATAAVHYRKAATAGNARAAGTLAVMILLEQLEGTQEEAIDWLNQCDEFGGDSFEALWAAGLEDPREG